jgi:hypothetical protein
VSAIVNRLSGELELSEWWQHQRSMNLADAFWQTPLLLMGAIMVSDVLDPLLPIAGVAGTICWYLTYLWVIVFALLALRDVIGSSIRDAAPFAPLVLALYAGITVVSVGWPHTFSSETALEITCTVSNLNHGGDLGFHSTCLFGYPMRQFLLQALPTLLFGPSVVNLLVLGGTYFLCGAVIFAGGLIRLYRSGYMGNLVAGLLLSVFLQLYYWNHFFVIFEQSIYPLSFALILGGLVLYFRGGDERRALPLVGIVLLWTVSAYTPSLAVYGLAVVALLYVGAVRRDLRAPALVIILLSAASFLISRTYRQDVNVGSPGALWGNLWPALEHLVYQNQGVPWSTPFLVFPLMMTVALALSGVFGRLGAVVGVWVALVFVVTITSYGHGVYGVDFTLHRALIIVPVLITMGALLLYRRRLARWRNALEVLLAVSLLIGVKYHVDYLNSIPVSAGLQFDLWIQQHVPVVRQHTQSVDMTWWPGSNADLVGATDSLEYFAPNVHTVFLLPQQIGAGCTGLTGLRGVIVAQAGAPCAATLGAEATSGRVHYVGTYPTATMRLRVYTA